MVGEGENDYMNDFLSVCLKIILAVAWRKNRRGLSALRDTFGTQCLIVQVKDDGSIE